MEEEKKKKRNKKKKNKQHSKVDEDTGAAGADDAVSASLEQHRTLTNGKNHQNEGVGSASADVDPPKHYTNGVEASSIAEEKQNLLQIQAALEESRETIKHLRNENALHDQKEACLEIIIDQLQNEKESWAKNEARLEEKIGIMSNEKASLEVKQGILEEKIRQLEGESNFLILKEKSNKETITDMEAKITKLLLQVLYLEESKNICFQENHRLADTITGLQAQLLNLENNNNNNISTTRSLDEQMKRPSELDVLNSQLEEACALVERLITENAELVEKVDELYVELGQYKARDWLSSSDSIIKIDETLAGSGSTADHISTSISVPGDRTEPPEVVQVQDTRSTGGDKGDTEPCIAVSNSFKSDESGEIVLIPLDENDFVQTEKELQGVEREKKADVPFMDAPLIGAPFRLISFVASYVSGADLVDKK